MSIRRRNDRAANDFLRLALVSILTISIALILTSSAWAVDISGEIFSEEWTQEESPYNVIGDIFLSAENELTINPGVEVIFQGNFGFEVSGILIARGREEQHIRFTSENGEIWDGMTFNFCDPRTSLVYCTIDNVHRAITCNNSEIEIMRDSIDAKAHAISCDFSSPNITDNYLIRAEGYEDQDEDYYAIKLSHDSNPVITDNKLIECKVYAGSNAYGIYDDGASCSPMIERNWIEVSSIGTGAGILLSQSSSQTRIYRNIIRVRATGVGNGIVATDSRVYISNNNILLIGTQIAASSGIRLDDGASATIINNIIIGNGSSTGLQMRLGDLEDNSGYNCYFAHDRNYLWGGIPRQGDITADPLFKDIYIDAPVESGYYLQWDTYPHVGPTKSPCIDTGFDAEGGDYPNDTTRCDIGRFWFIPPNDTTGISDPGSAVRLNAFEIVNVYPNPFNSTTSISFNVGHEIPVSMRVVDLYGRIMDRVNLGTVVSGNHVFAWDAGKAPSGEYFIILDGDGTVKQTAKVTLTR